METLKCQIKWIDAQGKPTPDDNDAVMLALFHPSALPDGDGCAPEISKTFPICAEHYARVDSRFKYENGGSWQFAPLPGGQTGYNESSDET